jgi:hypothetical protein
MLPCLTRQYGSLVDCNTVPRWLLAVHFCYARVHFRLGHEDYNAIAALSHACKHIHDSQYLLEIKDNLDLALVLHVAAHDVHNEPILEESNDAIRDNTILGGSYGIRHKLVVDGLVRYSLRVVVGLKQALLQLEMHQYILQQWRQLGVIHSQLVNHLKQALVLHRLCCYAQSGRVHMCARL